MPAGGMNTQTDSLVGYGMDRANPGGLIENNDTIGQTVPQPGSFTTLTSTGGYTPAGDITLANGKAIKTDTTTAHTGLIQAYDVNDSTYRTFITLTNGDTPSMAISAPSGGAVTIDGSTIGATTPGAATVTALTQTGAGANVFNSSNLDTDFTVKALTSGNAINYDAGTSALTFASTTIGLTGTTTVTGALTQTTGAVIINNGATDNDFTAKKLTSGNWLSYDAGTDALLANGATIGLTGATTQTGNFTQTGAGAVVFNNDAADTDFTVKAITSGNAISYDAGTSAIALAATTIGLTGAITHTGAVSQSGSTTYTAATSTTVLKQGADGKTGTFVLNGATPVSVSNTSITANSGIIITLKTVGGTVSPTAPNIQTITPSTGFTVAGVALDTSTYNYHIIESAA